MNGKLRNMTSIYLSDENNRLLLLYRINSRVIDNSYIGTAGGHVEHFELNDVKSSVLRELKEETDLDINDITDPIMRYVTLRYKKGEIRQNYYFFAKIKNSKREITSNEGNLKWFSFDEVSLLDMPHTAKYMLKHYIEEGHKNNKLYAGVATKYGLEFTELKEF